MIRKFEERDLETVMELWLAGNLQAHSFIPEQYWKDSRELVRDLLDFAKQGHSVLSLRVYQKNVRAVKFYLRNGFHIRREGLDEGTGEKEYEMVWKGEGR